MLWLHKAGGCPADDQDSAKCAVVQAKIYLDYVDLFKLKGYNK